MTGFDETVPPDDDPARDENAAGADSEQQRKPDPVRDEAPPAGPLSPTADCGDG